MEIVITGRHTEVSERFRLLAEDKLAKVSQLAPRAHRVDVEVSHERNPRQASTCKKVEITVRDRGPVIRAEAVADEPYSAFDLAFGKLVERLRRSRDRRKVHHGRQTPASVRTSGVEAVGPSVLATTNGRSIHPELSPFAELTDAGLMNGHGRLDGQDLHKHDLEPSTATGDGMELAAEGESPVVIRTKDHEASPMTLDQALYEMELVGHDFFLFQDHDSGLPSVVYRRRGWSYGVIRLQIGKEAEALTPRNGLELPIG